MTIKLSKAYDDFIKTRKYLDVKKFPDYLIEEEISEDVIGGYFYQNEGCYILVNKKDKANPLSPSYYLIIERSEFQSDDLTSLENILFQEFALGEFDLLNK